MNETEFRHQLFDLAEDAPSGSSAPPALLRRARRRVVLTIASSVAIAVLVVGMGIAGVRALQTAPTPADPPEPTPATLGRPRVRVERRHLRGRLGRFEPVRIADGRPPDEWEDGVLVEEHCGPGEYGGPIWSPDGRYLAYWHTGLQCPRPCRDVVISDRGGQRRHVVPERGPWPIAWSPDSTRVAVWDHWGEESSTIGVYGLKGERQTLLTLPLGF